MFELLSVYNTLDRYHKNRLKNVQQDEREKAAANVGAAMLLFFVLWIVLFVFALMKGIRCYKATGEWWHILLAVLFPFIYLIVTAVDPSICKKK